MPEPSGPSSLQPPELPDRAIRAYDYGLPPELIAQEPLADRGSLPFATMVLAIYSSCSLIVPPRFLQTAWPRSFLRSQLDEITDLAQSSSHAKISPGIARSHCRTSRQSGARHDV